MIRASGESLPPLRISAPQLCQLQHNMASGTFIGEDIPRPHLIHRLHNSSSAHIVQMTWAAVCISVFPTPKLKSTMCTLNIFPHLLRTSEPWSELLHAAAKHLALSWCICARHPGLASVWWPCPVCGPCWPRSNLFLTPGPIFRGAGPLRVASRRNRSALPRARPAIRDLSLMVPALGPVMLNNLQFARDHSPGYKMPHCFSQSTFNKMQRGYFMIFLQSPHLSFKMGGT